MEDRRTFTHLDIIPLDRPIHPDQPPIRIRRDRARPTDQLGRIPIPFESALAFVEVRCGRGDASGEHTDCQLGTTVNCGRLLMSGIKGEERANVPVRTILLHAQLDVGIVHRSRRRHDVVGAFPIALFFGRHGGKVFGARAGGG